MPQAFSRISTTRVDGSVSAVLAVPAKAAFAEIDRALRRNLLALALLAGLALALTWVISERLIVGPTTRLVGATSRLATGEFAARSGLRYEGGEIGELARAFDDMASSLERREAERRRGEEILRASEERYRGLFENANDIVYTLDPSGRVTSLNRAGEVILGYSRADALGMDMLQLVAPEHRSLAGQMIERKLSGDEAATTYELDIVTRDGRRVPLFRPNSHRLRESRR